MKMKNLNKIGILIVFIILLSNIVLAFAVSSAYWGEAPLELSPGETKDIQLTLQNIAGEEDLTVIGEVSAGSEIITLTDSSDTYVIPAGEKTKVNLRAAMPENAEVGKTYSIEVTFTTVTESEAGTFGLGSSIRQGFNVIVIEKPQPAVEKLPEKKPIGTMIGIIAAVILVVIVIIFLLVRKRRK